MKNNELDREFDKLVNGRIKRLSKVNLKQELDFRQNTFGVNDRDGDEVFGE